ncbi:uroporphyrinogen-III synthase [Pseudalkalibacillus hwajinpoensis]|uniref:uroporphyrinogen-III synthase n=1 Tax=Guptibacillus hwajinpoensis TaxID=208199 RepID=UPI001CFC5ADB|nr:uroporphyrinogen-III synthase [Pseudalkalibacillus hwajinpoensis]
MGLKGKRIAVTGGRKGEEIRTLIEKQGGTAFIRPAQGTVFTNEAHVVQSIQEIIETPPQLLIFTTGMGEKRMAELAEANGLGEPYEQLIRSVPIAVRGTKTLQHFKQKGITPAIVADRGTMNQLEHSLTIENQSIALQMHGENVPTFIETLERANNVVRTIYPYEHTPPEEEVLERLIEEMESGILDVVAFTSAIQVRYFFEYSDRVRKKSSILEMFNEEILPVAVGEVTEEHLKEQGVNRVLTPATPRMGAMVMEIANYYRA